MGFSFFTGSAAGAFGVSGLVVGVFLFVRSSLASSAIVRVLSAGLSARPCSSASSCAGVIFTPSFDGGSSVSSISRSVDVGGVLPVIRRYIVALMA